MTRLSFAVFFILLLIGPPVSAQQTLRELTLSPVIDFVLDPFVVTNDFQNEWLVAWDQSGKVKGRIVKPDGQLRSIKTLVKGSLVDAIYDPIHHTYLILYGDSGLRTQLLSGSLKKKGSSHLVQFPSAGYGIQLIFDPVVERFLVFWIEDTGQDPGGNNLRAIKRGILDVTGKGISEVVTLLDGGQVDYYDRGPRVNRNPENGNLFLRVNQISKGVNSILGYTLKSDGTLLRTKPVRFATKSVTFDDPVFSIPDAEFADNGSGIAAWAAADEEGISPTKIKIRQLTSKVTFDSKSKNIAEDDLHYLRTSTVFDRNRNVFLVLWDAQSSVDGVLLDANTTSVLKGPFTIAGSPNQRLEAGLAGAYESASGRILIVWTSACFKFFSGSCPGSDGDSGQVSGAIFSSK